MIIYYKIKYLWVPLNPLHFRAEVTYLLGYGWVSLINSTQTAIPCTSNKISGAATFLLSQFLKTGTYFFSGSYDLPIRHMYSSSVSQSMEGTVQPNESDPSPICCFWRTNMPLKIHKEHFSLFLSRSKISLALCFKGLQTQNALHHWVMSNFIFFDLS